MSGVVKAKVSLDLLIPAMDAEALRGMSLQEILAKVEHANWIAGPVEKTEPARLGNVELGDELRRLRGAGCHFDQDDVAELRGGGGWWNEVGSLEDLISKKSWFLADPGCDFDLGEMEEVVSPYAGRGDGAFTDPEVVMSSYFDHVVAQFAGKDTLTVYRDLPAYDVEQFIAGATQPDAVVTELIEHQEDEVSAAGGHWSLSEKTSCPDSGSGGEDLFLTAEVDADAVDWFTTFQAAFSRPWEMHVAFTGEPRLSSILERNTGVRTDVEASSAPGMR